MKLAKHSARKISGRGISGRGEESVALMEPMTVSEGNPARRQIDDLAFQLNQDANRLAGRLAPAVAASIGDLVRSMNCYYSNLIEGHDIHPIARPAFGPGGRLYFLAENRDLPLDSSGQFQSGLYLSRPGDAEPGDLAPQPAE